VSTILYVLHEKSINGIILILHIKPLSTDVLKKIKEDLFLADLQHINISQINLINDIQAATYMWYTLFMRIINKHAPLKTKRIKYSK
jgi:hypothetical protein